MPALRNILLPTLVALPLVLSACSDQGAGNPGEPGPQEVSVVVAQPESVDLSVRLPGRTLASRTAEIRPRVNGLIEALLFVEGSRVDAGQQLYQIEDDTYGAAHATAAAEVERAEAAVTLAQVRDGRLSRLLDSSAVSQQDVDEARASLQQARANLTSAQAQLDAARIDLDYTRIVAPISGRIGISQVTEGALVTALQAQPLATIHQIDPIDVEINQSAESLLRLRRQLQNGTLADAGARPVQLILEDGSDYEHAGELEFSEVSVSASTGTVTLRATFPNPDHLLLPGMFVSAELTEGRRNNAILLPQQSVMRDAAGRAYVWLVNDAGQVESRSVTTGRALGNRWLIESGIEGGEQVILAGFQRVQPGMNVTPVVAEAN